MPIYALGEQVPVIDGLAYVHPDAVVIGSVVIGPESSVWPGAVLRGDDGEIHIGSRTSIQDCVVIHTTAETFTTVGDRCVIGHLAHLEGCTVHDDSLIGVGAVVLHNVQVGSGAIVAAGAVVLDDTLIEPGGLALGIPAKVRPGAADKSIIDHAVATYVARAPHFRAALRRID
jgi:carbonic anhydrase/acetyltransferase-like protein (isoleucine patch superfamily)